MDEVDKNIIDFAVRGSTVRKKREKGIEKKGDHEISTRYDAINLKTAGAEISSIDFSTVE